MTHCLIKFLSFRKWCECLAGFKLTVSSDQSFNSFTSPLAESVHHEEQQGEDEEGRNTADDQPHSAGHRVKQAVSI